MTLFVSSRRILLGPVAALCVALPGWGETYYVSPTGLDIPPYTNEVNAATQIADAVALATDGDTVLVLPGTYTCFSDEAGCEVDVSGDILVQGSGPGQTIVDGNGLGRCFVLHPGAVVDGMTLRGGQAPFGFTAILGDGGAVLCELGGTVRNCVIEDSAATGRGGGVSLLGGGLVEDCVIESNHSELSGGGVACNGGGTVLRSLIRFNTSDEDGGGVELFYGGLVRNCEISFNTAHRYGGGVDAWQGGSVQSCTLVGNQALLSTPGTGGGVYANDADEIINTIIYGNFAGTPLTSDVGRSAGDSTAIDYCWGANPVPIGIENHGDDPIFVNNKSSDYRLSPNSPCIDAGWVQAWMSGGATDIDGMPRIGGGTVDVGAYERGPITFVVTDLAADGPGSLLEAITLASPFDTIEIMGAGAIVVSSAVDNTYGPSAFLIDKGPLIIEGNGVTIERDAGAPELRLFRISPGGEVTLRNVTLAGGLARGGDGGGGRQRGGDGGGAVGLGGGVLNQGVFVLENSTVTANQAIGGNSTANNQGGSGGGGGGLGSDGGMGGAASLGGNGGGPNSGSGGTGSGAGSDGGLGGGGGGGGSGISPNSSGAGGHGGFGGGGGGGGAYNFGGSPGGIGGAGGNGGFGGGGGGSGAGTPDGASGLGGFGGGNGGPGGGTGNVGGGGGGGAGLGGAIFNDGGVLSILNSTLSGNAAMGGNGSSIFGFTGGAGRSYGGGLFNLDGTVSLINVTIASNTIAAGTGENPDADGGAVFTLAISNPAPLSMKNCILADSVGGVDVSTFSGSLTGAFNIIPTSSSISPALIVSTNNPLLGALGDNGGLTWTHALPPNSPAIDGGDPGGAAAEDQRGLRRIALGTIDIGAFELQPVSPILSLSIDSNRVTELTFTNFNAASFTVLVTSDLQVQLNEWSNLTSAVEVSPGQYEFTDPDAAFHSNRFYRVTSP